MGAPAPLLAARRVPMRTLKAGDRIGTSQGPVTVLAIRVDLHACRVFLQTDDAGYRPFRWNDEADLIVPSPYTRPCPNCQVPIGDLCTQPTDTGRKPVLWTHLARDDA